MSIPSETIYGDMWAEDTVQLFLKKYARATSLLARVFDIPVDKLHKVLKNALRSNQARFEQVKRAVKVVHNDTLFTGGAQFKASNLEEKRDYLTKVKLKVLKAMQIDSIRSELILTGQLSLFNLEEDVSISGE